MGKPSRCDPDNPSHSVGLKKWTSKQISLEKARSLHNSLMELRTSQHFSVFQWAFKPSSQFPFQLAPRQGYQASHKTTVYRITHRNRGVKSRKFVNFPHQVRPTWWDAYRGVHKTTVCYVNISKTHVNQPKIVGDPQIVGLGPTLVGLQTRGFL